MFVLPGSSFLVPDFCPDSDTEFILKLKTGVTAKTPSNPKHMNPTAENVVQITAVRLKAAQQFHQSKPKHVVAGRPIRAHSISRMI